MQTPSIGRAVHYVSYGTPGGEYPSVCRAAIITEVGEFPDAVDTVGLCILNPTGQFFNQDVRHADAKAADVGGCVPGTWHWPEQVGPARDWRAA